MSVYQGRPQVGTIVQFWPGAHTNMPPRAAIVKKTSGNGDVVLQSFDPENNIMTHHNCVGHRSDPGLYQSNGTLTPKSRQGCWDFIPQEVVEPKAEAKKAK